jgi:hypothetical protein
VTNELCEWLPATSLLHRIVHLSYFQMEQSAVYLLWGEYKHWNDARVLNSLK